MKRKNLGDDAQHLLIERECHSSNDIMKIAEKKKQKEKCEEEERIETIEEQKGIARTH